jgi:hypothetical protein
MCVSLDRSICAILLHQLGTIKQITQLKSLISFEVCYELIIISVHRKVYFMQKKNSEKYDEHV